MAGDGELATTMAPADGTADAPADAPEAPPASAADGNAPAAAPPPKLELGEDHAKAALKIQSMQRAKAAGQEVEKLKAEGNLPGQVRARQIDEWGKTVFHQLDVNGDGKLSTKELGSALKQLPKTKPKKVAPGAKFQSVEDMMAAMDEDLDGSLDLSEWLSNLHKCAGLHAALAENVTTKGEIKDFKPEDFGEDHKNAVLKIQAVQRGRQTRKVITENDREGARVIFQVMLMLVPLKYYPGDDHASPLP
jgi:hypothetical protein